MIKLRKEIQECQGIFQTTRNLVGNDVEILDEEEEFLVQYEGDENDPDELLFK